MNRYHPELTDVWLLPVAAETWDGYLNDINGHHVTEETVIAALEAAAHEQPDEGSVGGGTGMNCYQFKGGNGTASRLVELRGHHVHRRRLRAGQLRPPRRAHAHRRLPRARSSPTTTRWRAASTCASAGRGLGHRRGRDRRPAVPQPVQGVRPAGHPRPGPHRHQRLALLRRHVPRVLHRQPRRPHPGDGPQRRQRRGPARATQATTSSPSSRGATWTRSSRPSSRPQKRPSPTP